MQYKTKPVIQKNTQLTTLVKLGMWSKTKSRQSTMSVDLCMLDIHWCNTHIHTHTMPGCNLFLQWTRYIRELLRHLRKKKQENQLRQLKSV